MIRVEGDLLVGSANTKFKGYQRGQVLRRWLATPDARKKEHMKLIFEKGNNKFLVEDYKCDVGSSNNKPIVFDYEFQIQDYLSSYKDELYLNLNLDKQWQGSSEDLKDRKRGVEVDYKTSTGYTNVFEIPAGYSVDFVPESVHFKHKKFGFTIEYSQSSGQLTYTKSMYLDALLIERDELDEWNKMIEALEKAYKEVVVLKKSN